MATQAEIAVLRGTATQVKNESQVGGNSAGRVGGLFEGIVDALPSDEVIDGKITQAVADIQPIVIEGDVDNAPDQEDLTSVNQGGTDVLKFKDKTYSPALFSGLGRVYLRKNIVTLEGTGKNVLTQAMVNTANTIYHIQYDYDLNGQTITIPAGCVLQFEGGSIKNGILVGSKTGIVALNDNIFKFDRTKDYLQGSWKIEAWNAQWFGAVPDGVCTENGSTTTFTGTDNYEAIQTALDTAYKCFPHKCLLPNGNYRISQGLVMNYTAYGNMEFTGEMRPSNYPEAFNGGSVLLCEGEFGIAVNRMRTASIKNIVLIGINYAYLRTHGIGISGTSTGMLDVSGWIGEQMAERRDGGINRYSPYAGIVIDGFVTPTTGTAYSEPTLPPYVSLTSLYQAGGSNRVSVEECVVQGFGIGVASYPSNADANGDYHHVINSVVSRNVYGVAIGNSQSRLFEIKSGNLEANHTAIITTAIGKQSGQIGSLISDCDFSACVRAIEFNTYIGTTTLANCYAELLYSIGVGGGIANTHAAVTLDKCYFKFGRPYQATDDLGVPTFIFTGPINIKGCKFAYADGSHSARRVLAIDLSTYNCVCDIEEADEKAETSSTADFQNYNPPLAIYNARYSMLFPHKGIGNFRSELWGTYQQERLWFNLPTPTYIRGGNFTYTNFSASDGTLCLPSNSTPSEVQRGDIIVCDIFSGVIIRKNEDNTWLVRLTGGYKKTNGAYSLLNTTKTTATNPMYIISRKRYFTLTNNYYLRVATHPSDAVITLEEWSNDLAVGVTPFFAENVPNSIRQNTGAIPYITAVDSTTKQVTFNRRVVCYPGDYMLSYLVAGTDTSVENFIKYMFFNAGVME